MNQYNAKHGLYGGIATIAISLLSYLISPNFYISFGGLLSMIPLIYFMVTAVKEKRSEQSGMIKFGDAFKHSWVSYLIAMFLSTIFSFLLYNYIAPDLIDITKDKQVEVIQKMSGLLGEEGTEKAIEELEKTNNFTLPKLLMGFLVSLVFPGALIALIIALVMKKENDPFA